MVDSRVPEDHDMVVGTAAGREKDTTAAGAGAAGADSADMEASSGPCPAHSTGGAGSRDVDPYEAVHRKGCAASDEELLAFPATAEQRSDSF